MSYFKGSVLPILSRLYFYLAVVVLITACSGPQKAKPIDLEPNVSLLSIRSAWVSSIGEVGFPIDIRSFESNVYVASSDGVIAAIDSKTGVDVWRAALGVKLAAGVGSDGRYTAVVSRGNEVITLSGGREIWRQKLSAIALTAPLVAGGRVFVLASDRSVTAYDAASGRRLWQQLRAGESLVLGQSGVLFAVGDTLLAGIGGRLVAMNPQNGSSRWEAAVATSRGSNEIERVIDLVSGISRLGSQVCARAFQTAVACVDATLGRVLWTKNASGSTGVGGDAENLFGTETDGKIISWRRSDGERVWVSERLRFRALTTPLLVGQSIVVGDESGLLHFLSRNDGSPLNRMPTDGSPIVGAPVLVGQTLVVVTRRGGVFGFRPE